MTKIWVKVMDELHIVKDFIYQDMATDSFFETVRKICESIDTPTPLILNTHKTSFAAFNQCKFKRSDFVETVPFDELILENIAE